MNVARSRATVFRNPGKTESIRKISYGRAKPAEAVAVVGQGPVKPNIKESDEAVFMDAEDSSGITFVKPAPTPFVDVCVWKFVQSSLGQFCNSTANCSRNITGAKYFLHNDNTSLSCQIRILG